MAKIPLRVYNHNIEKRIENHQTQEAIAHCKQILKFHPKHIDTYRLLGKAFLESQRYGEASDILQRVLSVVPDDFISQLGMSIIREDEGDLDGAIYHMERAFEVQPANGAIQEELRRLYGRRDGIQPPKIRLTRGALVRMYGRGELFTQAIAEANAALSEYPERLDMQVLLSRLHFQSGDKVKATEVASRLVEKLPYCYEANHILAEVLSGTSRPEDARPYQERLRALDPYLAFVSSAQPTSADVPDNAVMVDELEYDPEQDEASRPGWTQQVGLAWDETPTREATPDWLAGELPSGESDLQPPFTEAEPAESAQPAEIPDWMVAAGWKPSTGEETETHVSFNQTEEDLPAPAEMPDWLQELAPAAPTEAVEEPAQETEEDTGWLDQILGPSQPAQAAVEQPAAEAEVPEWLRDLEGEKPVEAPTPVEPESAMPDWITMESGEPPVETALEEAEATQTAWEPTAEGEPAVESGADIPDWLQELAQEPAAEAVPPAEAETPLAESVEMPPLPESTATTAEDSATAAPPEDMDAALAWLESLAARQGADEATLISQPDQRGAEMPEWLQKEAQASAAVEQEIPPESIESELAPEALEQAAPAEVPEWLREESAPVEPAAGEQVPEWLQEQPAVTPEEPVTEEQVPEWLQEQPTAVEPAAAEEVPEWLREQPVEAVNDQPAAGEEEAIPEWLREQAVAEEETAEEAAVPEWLQEQPETTPEAEQPAVEAEIPEWLQEQPQAASGELVESAEETTVPEWLQELSVQGDTAVSEPQAEEPHEKAELPEWLDIPTGEPAETADVAQEGVDLPEWLTEVDQEVHETALETPALEAEIAAQAAETLPEQPAAEAPNVPGDDIDAALAWLETLAAKQGADEETLVTRPEDRLAAPPDWVQQAEEQETAATAAEAEAIEIVPTDETQTGPELAEEMPEPVTAEMEEATPVEEPGKAVEIPAASEEPDTLGWVAEEEAPAEKTQPVRAAVEEPPATPIYAEGVSLVDAEEEEEDQEPLPEWLRGLGAYSADLEADLEEEEQHMAEWLPETDAYHERSEAIPQTAEAEAAITQEVMPVEAEAEITQEVMPVEPEPVAEMEAPAPVVEEEKPAVTQPVQAAAPFAELPERLQQAQTALEKGDIGAALADYTQFIQNGELLEETIHDLRDALYRHPVDVDIWQSLGDAYMRSNRIQEALDAYTKAEELLR